MAHIEYLDRQTGHTNIEKVYKNQMILLVYGDSWRSLFLKKLLLPFLTKHPFFSILYGILQKLPYSKKKIRPFINEFHVDESEFKDPVGSFRSFNDFFIRHLRPEARPISQDHATVIIPADGRYYFYQDIEACDGFVVKGKKFELSELLGDPLLAKEYVAGSMVIARLCPSDYHRFHFPCDCVPGESKLINGWLDSVNPLAIKKNIQIFAQNKRTLCKLETEKFGPILYMEIGAICVGSIKQTYTPSRKYFKGDEKGYFEFGGSSLILLFKKNTIKFDEDLIAATKMGIEVRCLMGQKMGVALL